jgi:integrase
MAAKVQWYRDAWWVMTHANGRRYRRRIGPARSDRRAAEEIARKVNGALALGTFAPDAERARALPCTEELRRWHAAYGPTMKPSYRVLAADVIERHLAPFFRDRDLRELSEEDLLAYTRAKLEAGLAPATIRNHLSALRRVLSLREREGKITRNPARGLGSLMRRVGRAIAAETEEAEHWTRAEVEILLGVAREREPRFAPLLALLVATGLRRGEALGLQWADVDFDSRALTVRRAITKEGLTTPKSGRSRRVPLTPALAEELLDLLGRRRREGLARGWADVPPWVFCSEVGTPWEPRNVERSWQRVRRRAQALGVRPLKLHSTRHTWATLALGAGRSVRWVADVLGHADPALTLRVYAHALRAEEADLSFADFGGPGRPYTAPVGDRWRGRSV